MGKTTIMKLVAMMAAVAMMFTACAFQNSNGSAATVSGSEIENNTVVTLGQLADYFIKAADDYNPDAERTAVLEGMDETEPATRLKMYVIASRTFGKLPAPTGNTQAIAPPRADLSGIPEWAKEALQNLVDGGVFDASDLGLSGNTEGNSESGQEDLLFEDNGNSEQAAGDFDEKPKIDNSQKPVPEGAQPDVVASESGNQSGQVVKTSADGPEQDSSESGREMMDEMETDPALRYSDSAPQEQGEVPPVGGSESEGSDDTDGAQESVGGQDSQLQGMDDTVTIKDAEILAARIFAAYGTNQKDDFYTAVNKNDLDTLSTGAREETAGGSSSVTKNTEKQLHDLILEIVNGKVDYPDGSAEQKIRNLYNNAMDMEERKRAGIQPLCKYLDAADAAQTMQELYATIAQAVSELGNPGNGIFPMIAVTDMNDSTKRVMQLMTMAPMLLSQEEYDDPENETLKSYRETMIKQLMAAGESEEDAQRHADGILRVERELAGSMMSAEEAAEIKNISSYYTPRDLDELMPQAKPSELFAELGRSPDTQMTVYDAKMFEAYAKYFTDENLELFQSMQKIALITGYSKALTPEIEAILYGQAQPAEDAASEAVQSLLSDELGQLYVAKYFPSESKAEIETMVRQMIDAFKTRINRLDWMDETTKQEALKKLDSITVLIGYPDEWELNNAQIKSAEDGGSYFANTAASEVKKWEKVVASLKEPVDPRRFALSAFTVNAAASRNTNTIIFPAGILQAPFYDQNASFEENLGAIGSTIAHEITHMFDDGGAQYDANGNVRDWWAKEDYKHFRELCEKAEAFYDGREAAPGVPVNGKETLSENIADIGGIACGLEILSTMENPDYDTFFRSFAQQWARAASHETLAELAASDMHAPNNLRTNRVLANFQEFADTYGIEPGDGMYVAPEDRIEIW
ncbi:hypothetical protein CE91St36_19480 [Christensenellaceae bacterium]|nr:hypothetical protein CE91St36_19480 [Christensenellaceae bacterium]BDF61797.1 hypothetical protein CE91St37_19470 [Christensenellaceae bacterium]